MSHKVTDLERELIELRNAWMPVHIEIVGDSIIMVVNLIAHVALYLNPTMINGADERYCYSNLEIALKAIEEYKASTEFKWWQKDHNRGLVAVGEYLYREHEHQVKENAIKKIDWNVCVIKDVYRHQPFSNFLTPS